MTTKFLVTCDPGLEDIVKLEAEEKLNNPEVQTIKELKGRVIIKTKKEDIKKLFEMHSIYHIIEILYEFNLENPTLEKIEKITKDIEIEELKNFNGFRVTSNRIGTHNFTSLDIQRVVGKNIKEKYNKKVDLKNYEIEIRADLIRNYFFIGIQKTKNSLHKRFKKVFDHKASIKPTIAYALLKLSEITEKDILLDPMCGSGTIVLEAASIFKDKINIFASDINENVVRLAQENAKINNLDRFISFRVADARELEKYYVDIDKIVTNPPYGVRLRENINFKNLYEKFLLSSHKILNPNGRITLITLKYKLLENLLEKIKLFKVIHKRTVECGGLFPKIYVIEKENG